MNHVCDICNYKTSRKSDLTKHYNTKKHTKRLAEKKQTTKPIRVEKKTKQTNKVSNNKPESDLKQTVYIKRKKGQNASNKYGPDETVCMHCRSRYNTPTELNRHYRECSRKNRGEPDKPFKLEFSEEKMCSELIKNTLYEYYKELLHKYIGNVIVMTFSDPGPVRDGIWGADRVMLYQLVLDVMGDDYLTNEDPRGDTIKLEKIMELLMCIWMEIFGFLDKSLPVTGDESDEQRVKLHLALQIIREDRERFAKEIKEYIDPYFISAKDNKRVEH